MELWTSSQDDRISGEIDESPVDGKVIQAVRYAEIPVVVGFMFRSHWASYIPTTSGVMAEFKDFRSRKSRISIGRESTQEGDRYTGEAVMDAGQVMRERVW